MGAVPMGAVKHSLVTAGLAAGSWLGSRVPRLEPVPPAGADASDTTVVIPARNEAGTLPALLASLRSQSAPPARVIVVDDDSSDGTAEIARAHGADVIDAPPLPEGWTGKAWACHHGASAVTTSTLVFLDADVVLAADGLARVLTTAAEVGGLVSVQPFARTERAYEQASMFCNIVAVLATGACSPVAQDAAGAFGPCLVMRRADYESVGGHAHEDVRASVVEDVALSRRFAAAGLPVHLFLGGDDVSFRMYPAGPAQLVEGWTKNMAVGAVSVRPVEAVATAAWVTACTSVASDALRALVTGRRRREAAVAYLGVTMQIATISREVGDFRPWAVAAWPLPLAAFHGIFVRSVVHARLRRAVAWRGRTVPIR